MFKHSMLVQSCANGSLLCVLFVRASVLCVPAQGDVVLHVRACALVYLKIPAPNKVCIFATHVYVCVCVHT